MAALPKGKEPLIAISWETSPRAGLDDAVKRKPGIEPQIPRSPSPSLRMSGLRNEVQTRNLSKAKQACWIFVLMSSQHACVWAAMTHPCRWPILILSFLKVLLSQQVSTHNAPQSPAYCTAILQILKLFVKLSLSWVPLPAVGQMFMSSSAYGIPTALLPAIPHGRRTCCSLTLQQDSADLGAPGSI